MKTKNLTAKDVATLLQIPLAKVQRWIQQGQIPCRFKGRACYFKKSEIMEWAKEHGFRVEVKPKQAPPVESETFSLSSGIEKGGVFFDLEGSEVSEIIANAVARMVFPASVNKKQIYERLLDREKIASTGIGKGVAIPHPRRPIDLGHKSPIIPVFFLSRPADFHSIDKKPVFVLFFIFSPSTQIHLKMLSKLSYLLREGDFLLRLKNCHSETGVLSLIAESEKMLDNIP